MQMHKVRCAGTNAEFLCSEDRPLLIAMERQAKDLIPVGCRGGGCGRCRIRIISGDFETKKMSKKFIGDSEQKENLTLACRTFPRSDVIFELRTPTQYDNKSTMRAGSSDSQRVINR